MTHLPRPLHRHVHSCGVVLAFSLLGLVASQSAAHAASVSLSLEASFPRSAPFGMAFGDGFIWWQSNGSTINQMTLDGVDTGVTATNPLGWSALAWEGGNLVSSAGRTVKYFKPSDSTVVKTTDITAPVVGPNLIDGLDIGPGGEIWYSPDVGNVYRLSQTGEISIPPSPFLGGAGGYSGVERIDINAGTYIFVVNDASNPRNLCIHELNAVEIGCTPFQNQRYEDLAYDGQYLWAADYFGNKIDKFCVKIDQGNCLGDPPQPQTNSVPAPLPILGALATFGNARRLRHLSGFLKRGMA